MQLPVRRESLPAAGALFAAALAGGTVAVVGAAIVGTGDHTTTVREIVQPPPLSSGNVSRTSDAPLTVRDIYDRDAPGVVQVTTTTKVKLPQSDWFGNPYTPPATEVQRSLGSGFVVDKAGYIVTNYHVVGDAQSVRVSFSNNDSMKARVVGKDPATDVALLKVQATSRALKPLTLGNSDGVHVGDQVAAIGNPLGLDRSITLGIVSALHRSLTSPEGTPIDRVIQTDAALNHGNSGGPLLNAQGQVVGVSSAVSTAGGESNVGIGFAIPINTVRDVVAELKAHGHVDHPYLGVVTRPVSTTMARIFNLPVQKGLLVESVAAGSGADRAGLRGGTDQVVVEGESYQLGGDVITKADGTTVSTTEGLREVVSQHKPGDSMTVVFYRGTEPVKAEIKLGRQSPLP
ncbi:MAG TPA: trypsin-like peptidase domain-containing protein [Gaiellaceae bacterium]|nr:trypsin-like peptidase domain-containing protein [Gaiellaceae bacterium]